MGVLFGPQAMTTFELSERLQRQYKTRGGVNVSEDTAMKYSAVYACVRVIAETCAHLPVPVYKRVDSGKVRDPGHWLTRLLDKPNQWQNGLQFRETMTGHVALRGRAYAYKGRVGNQVKELVPLDPTRMEVKVTADGSPAYEYTRKDGTTRPFRHEDLFQLHGLSFDGVAGLSPIALQREAIGLGLAAEKYGAQFFSNGAKPSGLFRHPKGLSDQAYERLKRDLRDDFSGENSLETMLLEEGLDWTKAGVDPKDAQTLELRQFQIEDVARGYRMPPHKIGHLLRSTNNNIEHQSLEFYTDTMLPWFARWEWALWELLSEAERTTHFAEFLAEGLLRGDSKARADYYKAALGDTQRPGWMTVDEVRALENLNEVGIKTFPQLITTASERREAKLDEPA